MRLSAFCLRGVSIISAEVRLFSPHYGLEGKVDLLVRKPGRLQVYEYKSAAPKAPNPKTGTRCWEGDAAQVLAYGLLVEEIYKDTPRLEVIYAKDVPNFRKRMQMAASDGKVAKLLANVRSVEVPFHQTNRAYVEECIKRAREIKQHPDKVRRNHEQPNKCVQCAQRDICPQRLG